ncbi:MAG: VanZ family protein [Candidatus Cloacimonas sp.]|nr:VanZ family protein [Candidatus Cloacimonadota bacterium]
MKNFVQRRIGQIFIGYSLLVLIVAVLPTNSTGHRIDRVHLGTFRLDHLIHTAQFLVWGIIAWMYIEIKQTDKKRITNIFVIGLILAICSELVQKWLPYRGYGLYDLLGNVSGVVLALLGGILVKVVRK